MVNINCSEASCIYMTDGKCCLDTVTLPSRDDNQCGSAKINKMCPYYCDKK